MHAALDLQVSLLSKHELTRLIRQTSAIAREASASDLEEDVEELKRDIAPEAVLEAIQDAETNDRRWTPRCVCAPGEVRIERVPLSGARARAGAGPP